MPSRFPPPGGAQQEPDDDYRPLLAAIKAGLAAEVDHLLAKERSRGDHPRNTALFKAAVKRGEPGVLRCLLRHGVTPLGESPLFAAIEDIKALEVVLAEGYTVHVTSSAFKTPLQTAVALRPSAVPVLLRAGCDVTARDLVQGNTPLHAACAQHAEDALLPLVHAGAWLNAGNGRGETPLHLLLRHACPPHDFHARSRQRLARCLIYMGCHVTAPSSTLPHRSRDARGGKPQYKVAQLHRRLLRETRAVFVWPLQHLCRLTVRALCEGAKKKWVRKESGGECKDGEVSMAEVAESLDLSCFLKDYLLYKEHALDKEALSPRTVRISEDSGEHFVDST